MYVVYHKDTTRLLGSVGARFATERAAKASLTRMARAGHLDKGATIDDYAIAEDDDFFANIERKVIRKNLRTGKEFVEGINTPAYMSPAHESYWVM